MGMLIDGQWHTDETLSAMQNTKGEYVRAESGFRDHISADGSAPFAPDAGRYHLFLAHSCPWAHRTHIALKVKGLEEVIGVSFAGLPRDAHGWWYAEGLDDLQPVEGRLHLHRLYTIADPACTGRVTTPTLWDRRRRTIVNNESADILRVFNEAFASLGATEIDLYPPALRSEIDTVNARIYAGLNNGVYRAGFARSQQAYEEACADVFETLDWMEARLAGRRYLAGAALTEADIRAFPTLVRFDAVYHGHFKCNLRRIVDYPQLWGYLRDLYQTPGFGETVQLDLIKQGYYGNSWSLNPSGVVPLGPQLDFASPHDRATLRLGE